MGIWSKLFAKKPDKGKEPNKGKEKKRVEESVVSKSHQPEFVQKERRDNTTYEIYKGTDAESARTFLLTKRVGKRLYYIVVETPEGNWGTDVEGLYLERLLPWQTKISSAKCEGHIIPMSWSMFGLEMAAKGYNDNFIAKMQCGKCEHKWLDGVRYQKVTVVSCPKCKMLNKVDSKNIQVVLV